MATLFANCCPIDGRLTGTSTGRSLQKPASLIFGALVWLANATVRMHFGTWKTLWLHYRAYFKRNLANENFFTQVSWNLEAELGRCDTVVSDPG